MSRVLPMFLIYFYCSCNHALKLCWAEKHISWTESDAVIALAIQDQVTSAVRLLPIELHS